ncbi:MAG: hypothetical protein ABL866_04140 [Devosia sp.]
MLKQVLLATSALSIVALWSAGAGAAEINKDLVPAADLAAYCAIAGIDTHTTATFTLTDGTVLSGTVHCEAEDMIVGSDDGPNHDLLEDSDDDESGVSSEEDDEDHSGPGGGDDDDEDDNSGPGGGDDDEEDDNSGPGGGDDGDDEDED